MTMNPPSSPRQTAIVIDASLIVAIVTDEPEAPLARAELATRTNAATVLYAPGVIVSEVLYVLCRKLEGGLLTVPEHAQAVQDFQEFLNDVESPPNGEFSLTIRAEAIRGGYSCRRSADGLYIALAEELTKVMPTVLLTFDQGLPKQAAQHAPTVSVRVL